jgi:predicted metal-binding membrane protein
LRPALVVLELIVTAWLIVLGVQATGTAGLLHHHALIEDGPPVWIGIPAFLVGWQVMIAAMMLPASFPTVRVVFETMGRLARPRLAKAAFLGAFAGPWTIFGLVAFLGDLFLHRFVDGTPWLAARPWLIEAAVLALAGAYQFAPGKRRGLATCRHPMGLVRTSRWPTAGPFTLGLDHARACLSSSWALMLLMFAQGFANLSWMAVLTALMVYEATGRYGPRAASAAGAALLLSSVLVLSGPGLGGA